MTQFERNQIRAKLYRLELDEPFVERYLAKLDRNCECYAVACRTIDRWQNRIPPPPWRRRWCAECWRQRQAPGGPWSVRPG